MAGGFLPEVVAKECFPATAAFNFDTEAEYNNLTQVNCDTLVGSAYFSSKFTKNLVVPKITNVSQEFVLNGNDVVESIEFPDLEYAHTLYADQFSQLKRISMPKLRHVHSIFMELESQEVAVDFPSLENVDSRLRLIGNWTSLDFPKLREVNDTASLCQHLDCSGEPGKPPMDISLPRLEQANERFEVEGNIASFSVPSLAKVGTHRFGTEFGGILNIDNFGEPLNVSLLQLTAANGVTIRGNLSDVNVPLLQDELEGFQVFTENPLSLNFPFEHGSQISIKGPIDSVHFPNMKNFTSLWVDSDNPFNCGALKKEIEKTAGDIGARTFLCSGKDVPGLSTGAKAGIGVGVAVGGILVIALGFFVWKRIGWRDKRTLYQSPY
ncbi:hypothetical protein FE257_003554 [Aspergillus nanangensis]|uniref:Uncharacterized protein n=1 Tax=Aspergillus nanangensis TaxID=2582783 RepID=A0AAD4CCJ4_ASPNN|nr:hypothetical protein FE257_003554 [Aspergillus nanangensis]